MMNVQLRCCLVGLILMTSGCGSANDAWKAKRPATVLASGMVTYKGQPLAAAIVVIQPGDPDGIGASGLTDQDGKFELKTFPPDSGAVPGSYSVMIMKMDTSDHGVKPGGDDNGVVPRQKSLIPEKYGNPALSGLNVVIPAEGNQTIQLDLKG